MSPFIENCQVMLSLEKLANANIKNRAEYTQLTTELGRLEREKQNELRMYNYEIQRFKAKYSKSNFNTDSPEAASNVKMYETHNPGFCFKRNGEHRTQQVCEESPSRIDFQELHFLLFTNGEVDIEKVLCLHLLSSHETKHLTPPRRLHTCSNLKKDSPLEQLIERSKVNNPQEAVLRAILPTYVLDIRGNPERHLTDERLSCRLLINEKILELIMTVITALEHSNPDKVMHLINLAEDSSSLKRIFQKEHIQDFIMTLKEHSLVHSCGSFILTQPQKVNLQHLEIRTPSGVLEDLVREIRSNVLQFPKRKSATSIETVSKEIIKFEENPLPSKKKNSIESVIPIKEVVLEVIEEDVETPKFRRKSVNYIKKNVEAISKVKRSSIEETESAVKQKRRKSSSKPQKEEIRRATSDNSRRSSTYSKREQEEEIKVHLKQTTCPACMTKWKIPLPEPKVPNIIKTEYVERPAIKTDSSRRVKNLIEQEEYTLSSYDRRYSSTSYTSTGSKKRPSSQDSLDLIALNILDLEKIRHEIRAKETEKKLEKFLSG